MYPFPTLYDLEASNRLNTPFKEDKNYQKTVDNAHIFSFLSDLAYKDLAALEWRLNISDQDKSHGKFIYFDDGIRTQGFILKIEHDQRTDVIITFRGTEYNHPRAALDDWIGNFATTLVPFMPKHNHEEEGPQIHKGFHKGLNSVWVEADLNRLHEDLERNSANRIWFAGHSLGGGLATLAAMRWACTYGVQHIGGIYTFGAPKCGNEQFKILYEAELAHRTFRFVNDRDIVPLLPVTEGLRSNYLRLLSRKIFGSFVEGSIKYIYNLFYKEKEYCHVAKPFYIDADGDITRHPTTSGWWQGIEELILDHDHREYLKLIGAKSTHQQSLGDQFPIHHAAQCSIM